MSEYTTDFKKYLTRSAESIVKSIVKSTLSNPRESTFILKFSASMKNADSRRKKWESEGEQIPAFLICSITNSCSMPWSGCYPDAENSCKDNSDGEELTASDWEKVFRDAAEVGIGFIILAGEEAMARRDVLEVATKFPEIIFAVFADATVIDKSMVMLLDRHRNIVPVLIIEDEAEQANERREKVLGRQIDGALAQLRSKRIIFASSVIATAQNYSVVAQDRFVSALYKSGCRIVLFSEPAAADKQSDYAHLGNKERELLLQNVRRLRSGKNNMLYICLPHDWSALGECLAAGTGFIHIDSTGGASSCPFSSDSDFNILGYSLRLAFKAIMSDAQKE